MKNRSVLSTVLSFGCLLCLLSFTSCQDGNLFGRLHDSGGSGDVGSLMADAENALRDRNYSQALDYYQRILDQDSDNAEALYGASVAQIGTAGLNFGQLISNIINQSSTGSSSLNNLSEYLGAAQEGVGSSAADPNSILYGIDLVALDNVIDTALCRLQRIVSGVSDGSINQNDVAVLLDYGSLCLLRAALRPIRANFFDITNTSGNYGIEPKVDFATFCGNSANDALLYQMARDVVGAYALFNRAVTVLNLSGNQIIVQLRNDIDSVATTLLDSSSSDPLPASCLTKLSNIGITVNTFRSNTEAFQPPSGC